jgi:hypothetical protein
MSRVDPAALEFRGSVSVDLTELHDIVLGQLGSGGASERHDAADE